MIVNRIVPFTFLVFFLTSIGRSQSVNCPDSTIVADKTVYSIQDSAIFEALEVNYYLAFESYLSAYIEISDKVDIFLDYISIPDLFNKDFVRYAINNKNCAQILQNDTASELRIGDGVISISLSNGIWCNPSVEGPHNKSMVRLFNAKGLFSQKDHLYRTFYKKRGVFYRKCVADGIKFKRYFSDEINKESSVVVIYTYDRCAGLSLIKDCRASQTLKQDDYTESLRKFADSFCRKHNLSKIIFSGLISE